MIPKQIQTEAENEAPLARLDKIFDAKLGTPDGDEVELLFAMIEAYEQAAYPIDLPDPIEAIRFRMEQARLNSKVNNDSITPSPIIGTYSLPNWRLYCTIEKQWQALSCFDVRIRCFECN